MPLRPTVMERRNGDHDLLIRLDTKFDILASKFDELNASIVSRVDTLEKTSAQWHELSSQQSNAMNDHETRIRTLEKLSIENKNVDRMITAGVAIAASFAVQLLAGYLTKIIK